MIIRYRIAPTLPAPARTILNVVQTAAKVNRSVAQRLIHDGAVCCGGRVATQTHLKLNVGDEVQIDYVPQPVKTPKKKAKGARARFEVVHDDEQIIVVNKPAGLLTVPSPKRETNTLRSQVRKWLAQNQSGAPAICVHRLDRGVSGLLVFAKGEDIAQKLRKQFSERKPMRKYVAVLQGNVERESGTLRSFLATDEQSLQRYSVDESAGGELAITHYRVQERWPGVTLVEIRLETGRRNQIRVHFAEAGHPVLGDPRYRPQEAAHPLWAFKRLALHAEMLGFVHPESGQRMQFTCPWPQEFRDFRRKVRRR